MGLVTRNYFLSESCCLKVVVLFLGASLARGLVCSLQCSRSMIRVSQNPQLYFTVSSETPPNLEDQVPIVIFPRNRVAQLYPRALGSPYIISYDSQGYGGGILTHFHTGYSFFRSRSYFTTDGQSVSMQYVLVSSPL
jgi:hypothetical protein